MHVMSFCFLVFLEFCTEEMTVKNNIFIIIILLLTSFIVLGQNAIVKPSLIGARNSALADADISGSYNISSMYLNPAALIFVSGSSIFFNHSQIKNNLGMSESLAFPILSQGPQVLSMGLDVFHLGYVQPPYGFSGQHVLEYGCNIAFASALSSTFSMGISADLQKGNANGSQALAASYSIGMDYSPTADINYGAVFSGIGTEVQYIPQNTMLNAQADNAPKILEIGATMSYPSSSSLRRKVFFLSLANEKIFGETGLFYKAGIEVRPFDFLSLRYGFITGIGVSEASYGIGFQINSFIVDYVLYPEQASYMLEQISLSYNI